MTPPPTPRSQQLRFRLRPLLLAAILLGVVTAGCNAPAIPDDDVGRDESYQDLGYAGSDPTGRDPGAWPDLAGRTLRIVDHGAFAAFGTAAGLFANLTGAKVEHIEADGAGGALNRILLEGGSPSADVIYGLDNLLLARADEAGVLQPYTPLLADRVPAHLVFFGASGAWPATPVDHGYIGVNWDPRHDALGGANLTSLDDVRDHAGQFVTNDPNLDTPGLGFLLATIATYGEDGWQAYWEDLFEGGVLVTTDWAGAYEQHFSAGYGADPAFGGLGDKPIVVSYTESPAYEAFYGRPAYTLAKPLLAPESTFRQVQTMAILKGASDRAVAEAWIEFTLTDAFQELAAPSNGVYPVVASVDTNATYGDIDPEPGTFTTAQVSYRDIGANLERWLSEWRQLCERHDCR